MSTLSERQSRFDLKTIIDTSRLLVESHDLDFILNNLLLICMGKLLTPRAIVLIKTEKDQEYEIVKSKGLTGLKTDSRIQLNLPDSCYESVTDLLDTQLAQPLTDCQIRWLFPISTSNQLLGFLGLGSRPGSPDLSPHEREFLESLTILSAVGISNSRMFKELKQTNRRMDLKVQELNTLFELSKEFNATVDRNQILRIFKFALMGQFFIRTFFMALKKSDGSVALPASSGLQKDFSEDDLAEICNRCDEMTPVSAELSAQIPVLKENNIEALIPLKYENEFHAVVGIGKQSGNNSYSGSDYEFIQSVGNLTLLSIQKTYLLEEQVEKRRIEEDLKLAREIQLKLLPDKPPEVEGLDLFGHNLSSRQIGGDYYEMMQDEGKIHCAIADVTGKGISASLLMANLQSMFHVLAPLHLDMSQTMGRLNEILYKNTTPDKFITFFWCTIDPSNQIINYSNAGHNPPLRFHANTEEVDELRDGGLLLGAMPTMKPYVIGSLSYQPGDLIVMYTDGVTEAMNDQEELYGEERLIRCIHKVKHQSAKAIWEAITEDVTRFSGGEYGDDVTMLIIKVKE